MSSSLNIVLTVICIWHKLHVYGSADDLIMEAMDCSRPQNIQDIEIGK
jgi:hypothetical protein